MISRVGFALILYCVCTQPSASIYQLSSRFAWPGCDRVCAELPRDEGGVVSMPMCN